MDEMAVVVSCPEAYLPTSPKENIAALSSFGSTTQKSHEVVVTSPHMAVENKNTMFSACTLPALPVMQQTVDSKDKRTSTPLSKESTRFSGPNSMQFSTSFKMSEPQTPCQLPPDIKKPLMQPRFAPPGVSMARYKGKLEECANLHRQLQELATVNSATREQLYGVRAECDSFRKEILRLRDILSTTTDELHSKHHRMVDLERENTQLREELRAKQMQEMRPERRIDCMLSHTCGGNCCLPSSQSNCVLTDYGIDPTRSSRVPHLTEGGDARMTSQLVHEDTMNSTGAIGTYVSECFRVGLLPHMEILHSLHDGGRLAAVEPPITFAQLNVVQRLVSSATWDNKTNAADPMAVCHLSASGQLAAALKAHSLQWCNNVELLTFRSETWHTSISLLLSIIRALKCVHTVEVFAISDVVVMQQLAEILLMELHVEALSLPELSLDDEGLVALFALISRRRQLSDTNGPHEQVVGPSPKPIRLNDSAALPAKVVHGGSVGDKMASVSDQTVDVEVIEINAESVRATTRPSEGDSGHARTTNSTKEDSKAPLTLHCLDLGRCTVTNPTSTFRMFQCDSLKVLILPSCAGLRDIHIRDIVGACPSLHTLDVTGNPGLSSTCIMYISAHAQLKVLRIENCPGISHLNLANIEVLFSSLSYVISLRAPELRRLPVPITHSRVLFNFVAPKLTEITLKGIVVDHGTLKPFADTESLEGVVSRLYTPMLSSSSAPVVEKVSSGKGGIQLLSVGFIDCTFVVESELQNFVKQQNQLLRFSVHGCRGVTDSHLLRLPCTLLELDVGGVGHLTNKSIEYFVNRLTQLLKLNLKNAGQSINNNGIRLLKGLVNLEVLNLLQMPQITPEVVAAVVSELPQLRELYHESAIVGPCPKALLHTSTVRVWRSDEEDATRHAVGECAKELLQLRDETALALWMEAQLPKPVSRLCSHSTAAYCMGLGQTKPMFDTTYYNAARQRLSEYGISSITVGPGSMSPGDCPNITTPLEEQKPDVLVLGEENINVLSPLQKGEEEALAAECEECSASSTSNNYRALEDAMDEKGRIAMEKKPLGPWDEEDVVKEHRRGSTTQQQ
ncbi:putative leucine-rich repeat protein [Trypanosoma vivax]|nr:putative leucine-rich repeat protein [Trypanosoma vivax]